MPAIATLKPLSPEGEAARKARMRQEQVKHDSLHNEEHTDSRGIHPASGLENCWCMCAKCWDPNMRRCICKTCPCWRERP